MDYEKKYKEALKMAKGIIRYYKEHNRSDEAAIEDLEGIFPELKESEDEKIRKDIINTIHLAYDCGCSINKEQYDKYLAWLEKQGDSPIKWNKNIEGNKPQVNHSVLMKTTLGIVEGEWKGEYWLQYRWVGMVEDSDVLSWMELSDLDKQDGHGHAKLSEENDATKK